MAAVLENLESRKLLSGLSVAAITSYPLSNNGGSGDHAVVADLNGDGHPDAIAIKNGSLYVDWGNVDGTFSPPQLIGTCVGFFVAVADLNGDGQPGAAFVVDQALDINGDGQPDADVTGQTGYDSNGYSSQPTFGGDFTFVGIGARSTSSVPINTPYIGVLPGDYQSNGDTAAGSIFNNMQALQVQVDLTRSESDTVSVPVANIVVPTGTVFKIQGTVWNSSGVSTQINGMTSSLPMGTQFGGTSTAGS